MDKKVRAYRPVVFLAIVLGFSFVFFITAALVDAPLSRVFHYIGGVGPMVAALILLFSLHSADFRKNYFRRCIDFRAIKPWSYLIIIGVVVLYRFGGPILKGLVEFKPLVVSLDESIANQPINIIPILFFIIIFGPIPEELGWRGYCQDSLAEKYGLLNSSMILGMIWSFWHLPLFFIEGSYQNTIPVGSIAFWVFILDLIPKAVIMGWIYYANNRSILSAILFHFLINLFGEIFVIEPEGLLYQFAILLIIAVVFGMDLASENNMGFVKNDDFSESNENNRNHQG